MLQTSRVFTTLVRIPAENFSFWKLFTSQPHRIKFLNIIVVAFTKVKISEAKTSIPRRRTRILMSTLLHKISTTMVKNAATCLMPQKIMTIHQEQSLFQWQLLGAFRANNCYRSTCICRKAFVPCMTWISMHTLYTFAYFLAAFSVCWCENYRNFRGDASRESTSMCEKHFSRKITKEYDCCGLNYDHCSISRISKYI